MRAYWHELHAQDVLGVIRWNARAMECDQQCLTMQKHVMSTTWQSSPASHTDMASLSQQCCLQLQILVLMQDNAG